MLKDLLASPAVNVFLGTLPLLGAILWGMLQNNRQIDALRGDINVLRGDVKSRFDGIDQRLGRMETRVDSIDGKLSGVGERLAKVETRLEGGHVVVAR
jgi:hypothetical protein